MLLRYGLGAENLAWSLMFAVQPLGCVYYPVSTLPAWLQPVAWCLPPTYVFEGLRGVLIDHVFRADLMMRGLAIDIALFVVATLAFSRLLAGARRAGSLLQTGE
jgi:ABC-2 type transport system permease protein